MKSPKYYEKKIFISENGSVSVPITERLNKFAGYMNAHIEDMREKSSITPDTHQSRTLFVKDKFIGIQKEVEQSIDKKIGVINDVQQKLSDATDLLESNGVIDSGQKKGIGVGISNKVDEFSKLSIKKNNFEALKLANVQFWSSINLGTLVYFEDKYYNDISITRYGIDVTNTDLKQDSFMTVDRCNKQQYEKLNKELSVHSAGSKKEAKKAEVDMDILLHPSEIVLIKEAIASQEPIVLVDIFARDETGAIKPDKNPTKPETHTIILYKNAFIGNKQSILVIDPNNSDSSKHLSGDTLQQIINIDPAKQIEILVPGRQIKIYESKKGNTGSNSDQYRECVDECVKVVDGLVRKKIQGNLSFKAVQQDKNLQLVQQDKGLQDIFNNPDANEVIKQITNNTKLNDNVPVGLIDKDTKFWSIPLRIKQASDAKIREKCEKLLTNINNQLKSIIKYTDDETWAQKFVILETKYTELLKTSNIVKAEENNNFISLVRECYNGNATEFTTMINEMIGAFKVSLDDIDNL